MSNPQQTPPPRSRRLRVEFDDSGESIQVVCRYWNRVAVCYLTVLPVMWFLIVGVTAFETVREPDSLFLSLFLLVIWAFGVSFCVIGWGFVLFSRERFKLTPRGVTSVRKMWPGRIVRCRAPLGEITGVNYHFSDVNMREGVLFESWLELQTLGKPLRFFEHMLLEPELVWLQYVLSEQLETLGKSP